VLEHYELARRRDDLGAVVAERTPGLMQRLPEVRGG
jgi:hypothetical protein